MVNHQPRGSVTGDTEDTILLLRAAMATATVIEIDESRTQHRRCTALITQCRG
jgi:hypothetical protein